MRLLHTADLHLGKMLSGHLRYDEQQQVLAEIVAIANAQAVDLVLIAGDVFDTYNPSAQAQQLFFTFMEQLAAGGRRPVVAIAGNHDQPQRLAAASPLALAQNIYLLGEPKQELIVPEQNETFHFYADNCLGLNLPSGEKVAILALPYISEARLGELYRQQLGDEASEQIDYECCLEQLLHCGSRHFGEGINLVMAHLSLLGGQSSQSERTLAMTLHSDTKEPLSVGGSFGVSSRIFPEQAHYVALGHFHRPQEIGCAHYAGSPLAYSFSEAGQVKSVLIVDVVASGTEQIKRVPLASGYPLYRMTATSYAQALTWCEDEHNQELWVELSIQVSQPPGMEEISALRRAHPRLLDIVLLFEQVGHTPQSSINEDLSIEDKFHQFALRKEGVEPEPELVTLFLELLNQSEEDEA